MLDTWCYGVVEIPGNNYNTSVCQMGSTHPNQSLAHWTRNLRPFSWPRKPSCYVRLPSETMIQGTTSHMAPTSILVIHTMTLKAYIWKHIENNFNAKKRHIIGSNNQCFCNFLNSSWWLSPIGTGDESQSTHCLEIKKQKTWDRFG